MDVRVDERRREHEPAGFDDPVGVRLQIRSELRDHAAVDADVERGIDILGGIDHARAANDEIVAALLAEQHHAAPISCRAPAWTPVGPCVSRS